MCELQVFWLQELYLLAGVWESFHMAFLLMDCKELLVPCAAASMHRSRSVAPVPNHHAAAPSTHA